MQTFEWEGMPGHIMTDPLEFRGSGRRTHEDHQSEGREQQEDLQGMIDFGMEQGMRETYDRLEELLGTLTARAR